jgi:DNA-binding NtrC family response regulator
MNVLLIDNDELVLDALTLWLEQNGFRVNPFNRSQKAQMFFSENPSWPDVIITECAKPYVEGLAFSRFVLSVRQDLPIILCSSEDAVCEPSDKAIFFEVFTKPFDTQHFLATLSKLQRLLGISDVTMGFS